MHPTPFPDINSLLEIIFTGVKEILADKFYGMYLFGSLASGDFNEDRSDIDFVIVTTDQLPDILISKLQDFSNQIIKLDNKWTKKLEGSFIPVSDFKNNSINKTYPSISTGGIFGYDNKEITNPIQRQVLREHGITLFGPNPNTFIDPVDDYELKQATIDSLHHWWKPQIDNPERLTHRDYQAYAVLTMCRMLYTLKNGVIVSKPTGAKWVKDNLDPKWRELIDRALMRTENDGINDLEATLDFIRYALSQTQ
jgi:hypothetical protein